MFLCRLPSFNELEQHRAKRSWRRWLGGHDLPSADALAYVAERIDLDDLRQCQGQIYATLKGNKALEPRRGWMLAAVDGHEIGHSEARCCEHCCKREVKTRTGTKTQFYHRVVLLQLLGQDFRLMLDVESVFPGEDEVAAAERLIRRVLRHHPRCFDVLTADAIYLRPSVVNLMREHDKHLVAVLKDNQPELLGEARTLLARESPKVIYREAKREIEHRELDGFRTESITTPLRVVHSHELKRIRKQVGGQWEQKEVQSDWYWATTLPISLVSSETIAHFGHSRWEVENEGFNELVTHWHADHYFHHHENAVLVLWLIMLMAHAVFHCFYRRNLKAQARRDHTVIYFAGLLGRDLRTEESWWPPP
jgi:hypothetical protein